MEEERAKKKGQMRYEGNCENLANGTEREKEKEDDNNDNGDI